MRKEACPPGHADTTLPTDTQATQARCGRFARTPGKRREHHTYAPPSHAIDATCTTKAKIEETHFVRNPQTNARRAPARAPLLLSLLEAVLLPLVKQVRLRAAQIDDLRAPISVLFHLCAFSTIIGIGNPRTAANHAPPLIRPIIALVADSNEGTGSDIRIAHHTFAVAFFAEAPDGDARLLAAHDEVGVVFGHGCVLRITTAAALTMRGAAA